MVDKTARFYTEDHEWVELLNPDYARIGITDYAVEQLGDVVFVELPDLNDAFEEEEEFGTIESVKSSSEIYTPVGGTVTKVNETLEDEPELVNESPYEEGWLIEIQSEGDIDTSKLMSYEDYQKFISEQ